MSEIDDTEILRVAQGLFDRHGESALLIARERVDVIAKQRNQPELDVALLILTAVERLQTASAAVTTTSNEAAGPADPAAMNVGSGDQAASMTR